MVYSRCFEMFLTWLLVASLFLLVLGAGALHLGTLLLMVSQVRDRSLGGGKGGEGGGPAPGALSILVFSIFTSFFFLQHLHPFLQHLHPFLQHLHPFLQHLHPFLQHLHPFSQHSHPVNANLPHIHTSLGEESRSFIDEMNKYIQISL